MMSSRAVLVASVCVLSAVVGYGVKTIIGPACPPKSECVCKAETCPAPEACPAPSACPPQPTLEIRRPLSVEVDTIAAGCAPKLAEVAAALNQKMREVAGAIAAAKAAGVNPTNHDWVADPVASAAGMRLVQLHDVLYDEQYSGVEIQLDCNDRMRALLEATDGWKAVNDTWEREWARDRAIVHSFYEVVGEYPFSFNCDVIAGRMRCPLPDEPSAE